MIVLIGRVFSCLSGNACLALFRFAGVSLNSSEAEKLNAELNSAVDSAKTVDKELLTLIMQSS
jgi:hypothetical protein